MNGVAIGGSILSQQHGLPLTKADLATAASECPTYEKQRLMLSPRYVTISGGDQLAI